MEVLYGVPEKEAAAGGGRTKSGLRTGKILAKFSSLYNSQRE